MNMKDFIKYKLYESLIKEEAITNDQLKDLESELDNLFSNVGIDVEFTKHFLDRVNDERNQKEITLDELRRIFKDVYSIYADKLKKYSNGFEGVFRNPPTDINIPFHLEWDRANQELDLINKTVMRKRNFQTTNDIFYVSDKLKNQQKSSDIPVEKQKEPIISINGVKWVIDVDNEKLIKKNDRTISLDINDIIDKLDDESQEKILSLL